MRRRHFISHVSIQSMLLSCGGVSWAMGEKRNLEHFTASTSSKSAVKTIGRNSLHDIRDTFKSEFFDLTLPLWKNAGVDWDHGGYLPHLDNNGVPSTTNKQLYYQSRVLWLYSYFYNKFDPDDYNLRAAKCGYDFLIKYCVDEKYDWFTEVTRDGKPVVKFYDIYASIYMILGLGEYYKASGNEEARDLAVKTAYRVTEIILSPTYQAQGHGPWYEPGTKRLGTWLHLLNALTPLLRYTEEPGVEKIARMCVRYMLSYHWQPDLGVAFEILQPDMTPHPKDLFIDDEELSQQNQARWVNNFHTMEAAWMIMEEALRIGNKDMFTAGLDFGRIHLEKCWVERGENQGVIQFFRPDDPNPFDGRDICKPYVLKEILIMLLLAIEHTGEPWAIEWFDKVYTYSYGKPVEWPYRDTLHQPRGVMFCYEIIERMIARNGRISSFFD